jgi:hypothetical protein
VIQFCVEEALLERLERLRADTARYVQAEQDAHEKARAELERVTGGVR